jgi:hypothetical protein
MREDAVPQCYYNWGQVFTHYKATNKALVMREDAVPQCYYNDARLLVILHNKQDVKS